MRSLTLKIIHKEDYRKVRQAQYPTLGDQLDALWHAMDQGVLPKIEPLYSDILAVKQAIPKPSN